jgi:hypothetical protein
LDCCRHLTIEDGLLVEHWDVIQDEATEERSESGAPMFGKSFPIYKMRAAGAMANEGSYVALALKVWKAQIERADKLFGDLSSESVLSGARAIATMWKSSTITSGKKKQI